MKLQGISDTPLSQVSPTEVASISLSALQPLALAQQRLWFLSQFEPPNATHNVTLAVQIHGTLQRPILEQSLARILQRHEILRTTFVMRQGQPSQIIGQTPAVELTSIDLAALPAAAQEAELKRQLAQAARQPFDLSVGPLARPTLWQLGPRHHVLSLTISRLVADASSLTILARELMALYTSLVAVRAWPLAPRAHHYGHFVAWERAQLQANAWAAHLDYWRAALTPLPPILELTPDTVRPAVKTFEGAALTFRLPLALSNALRQFSAQTSTSLANVLLAGFQALLWRYTGQADFALGLPTTNRPHPDFAELVGPFGNLLPCRANVTGNPTFKELVARVAATAQAAAPYQDLPFEKLLEELPLARDLSHNPLFQITFALQEAPPPVLTTAVMPMPLESGATRFDLALTLDVSDMEIVGQLEYNTDLFRSQTIARLAQHFETLLANALRTPTQPLAELALFTTTEQQLMLHTWNQTQVAYKPEHSLAAHFETQVARTPNAPALNFAGQTLTYEQLNQRANQLAHYLQQQGVGPETLVGVCADRSIDLMVALLGILKAGGAYVPLDPAYPPDRIAFMLADTRAPILLTQAHLRPTLPPHEAQVFCLDDDWPSLAHLSDTNLNVPSAGDHLAYIIYTSGSTGRPKGVAIAQRNVAALIAWAQTVFSRADLAGVLASTSICFDLSVFELFVTWSVGGQVILVANALEVLAAPARNQVTLINTVPSALSELLRLGGVPANTRILNLAGEALKPTLVQQAYQLENIQRVYNLYGPTEDTTYSTYALLEKDSPLTPPIGRPIANTQAYVLDRQGQPVPMGVPGELYLGGDGVARGYLNRPDLTAEQFIPDPFSGRVGARLYRTGDLVRYQPDGTLDFLGRLDRQVKIRGFRIELGEVEAILSEHPAVREVAIITREYKPGNHRLVAYLTVPPELPAPTPAKLHQFLLGKLPDYMLPAAYIVLDALPLTPNHKIDRQALANTRLVTTPEEKEWVAPRTPLEEALASFWSAALKQERVGVHDDFFDLGGHSLLATQVIAWVRQVFRIALPLRCLFEAPTVATLATTLTAHETTPGQVEKIAQIFKQVKAMPTPAVQQALQQRGQVGGVN